MRVLLFGATGMVGQGVLRECLLDSDVESILSVGRSATGTVHPKFREVVRADLGNLADLAPELAACNACFYCLGVASSGMTEQAYERITYRLTLDVAELLAQLNPRMTFVFVSGAGADSSERGRIMWARVKGKAENAVLRLPFDAAYVFRPAFIEPLHGMVSRTRAYRIGYKILKPLMPIVRAVFPKYVLTTEQIGRAMLSLAKHPRGKRLLESRDIRELQTAAS